MGLRTGSRAGFSLPGKPTGNSSAESINGRFHEEYLNEYVLLSLEDAKGKIDARRRDYNEAHSHSAQG